MVLITAAIVAKISAKVVAKLLKGTGSKGLKPLGSITASWKVTSKGRRFAVRRGKGVAVGTLAVLAFEHVTRPMLAMVNINLPSSEDAATDLVAAMRRGDFDVQPSTIATGVIGGSAVRDQMWSQIADQTTSGTLRVGLRILLFVL